MRAVVSLRSIKSDEEIAEMEIAAEIGYKMHMCVFKMAKPGIKEQEIAGMMDGISYQYGEDLLSLLFYQYIMKHCTILITIISCRQVNFY